MRSRFYMKTGSYINTLVISFYYEQWFMREIVFWQGTVSAVRKSLSLPKQRFPTRWLFLYKEYSLWSGNLFILTPISLSLSPLNLPAENVKSVRCLLFARKGSWYNPDSRSRAQVYWALWGNLLIYLYLERL